MPIISVADLPHLEVTRPQALWLLLLLLPLLAWSARSRAGLPRARRRLALITRVLIVGLLIGALAGLRVMSTSDRLGVIFVLDHSLSLSPQRQAWESDFIRQAMAKRRVGDSVGVVVFGRDAAIDLAPADRASIDASTSVIAPDGTDISRALALAEASFPQDMAKRVVLLSDGNETQGDAQQEAAAAGERGVAVWTVAVPEMQRKEVLVDRVEAPPAPRRDEPFELRVTVKSTSDTAARLLVKRNGVDIGKLDVGLHGGDNVLFIPQTVKEAGVFNWQVTVEAEGDSNPANNSGSAVASVQGPPRVLYLVANDTRPGFVAQMLMSQGMTVEVQTIRHLPDTLVEMSQYAAIVLANVSAVEVSDRKMKLLASYVRDAGGGLVMFGGPDGYGAGGWYRTPVEDVLPVRMDIRKRKTLPTVALALVIDKSGSMGEMAGGLEKMALAREAAIASLEMLGPYDFIGVIAFDEAAKWVVEMQPARDRQAIAALIATLRPGGGTAMYPGLYEAYQALQPIKAPVKHAIVLSDGETAPGDFNDLVPKMRAAHITISTVAIGQDADRNFMQKLANDGKGSAYYTDNASLLPRIITRDTVLSSHSAVVEEPFVPRLADAHPITRGLSGSVPALLGYDMTTPREHASVPLVTPKDDPLLAAWRSGLGKSVAFTSDDGRRWSGRWADWSAAAALFSQAVRWTMSDVERGGMRLQTKVRGNTIQVEAETDTPTEAAQMQGAILDSEGESHPLAFEQTAPRHFEARYTAPGPGAYMVSAGDGSGGHQRRAGVVLSYSPELRALDNDRFLLERVAALSGGRAEPRADDVFTTPQAPVRVPHDIWRLLALAAALLFPLDVALRRVFLPAGWWLALRGRRGGAAPLAAAGDATLNALKGARRKGTPGTPPPLEGTAVTGAMPGPRGAAVRAEARADGAPSVAAPSPASPASPPKADTRPAPKAADMPESDTLAQLREARRARRKPP